MTSKPEQYQWDVCRAGDDSFSVLEYYAARSRKKRTVVKTILNYTAPVFAAAAFVLVVNHWTGIEYNVTKSDSTQYFSDGAVPQSIDSATYSTVAVSSSEGTISDQLLDSAKGIVEQGSGLYIDGEFIAATSSAGELQLMLDGILEDSQTTPDSTVEFVNPVDVKFGLYATSQMDDVDEIKEKIEIADENAAAANSQDEPEKNDSTPLLAVRETLQLTSTQAIPYKTKSIKDKSLDIGVTKVKVEGVNGEKEMVEEIVLIDGKQVSREIISETVTKNPVTKEVLVGTKISLSGGAGAGISTGRFGWPVKGGTITSRFGYRSFQGGQFHTGLDIGVPKGTAVVASDGGVVTKAGWYGGYGYAVIIEHEGGYSTLYGHNSSILVKVGQKVSKGQQIAKAGSTGNSTGPHCHFEIRINGSYKNPLNYLNK